MSHRIIMQKRFLKINSVDRDSGGSFNNFTITGAQIVNGLYQLATIYLPNTYPNINAYNGNFILYDNGTQKTVTLAPGYYTTDNLPTALQTAMNAVSGGYNSYTVVYNSLSNKLSMSAANSFQLRFVGVANNAATLFGFDPAVNPAAGLSVASSSYVNLNPVNSYNITVTGNNSYNNNIQDFSKNRWYSMNISPTVNSNNIQVYESGPHNLQYLRFNDTHVLNISVYDDSGNPIQFESDWSMLLKEV